MLGFDIKTTSAKDALEVYDNMEDEATVVSAAQPAESVSPKPASAPVATAVTPAAAASPVLGVGTRVRAKLPSWESMYPGVITAVLANN